MTWNQQTSWVPAAAQAATDTPAAPTAFALLAALFAKRSSSGAGRYWAPKAKATSAAKCWQLQPWKIWSGETVMSLVGTLMVYQQSYSCKECLIQLWKFIRFTHHSSFCQNSWGIAWIFLRFPAGWLAEDWHPPAFQTESVAGKSQELYILAFCWMDMQHPFLPLQSAASPNHLMKGCSSLVYISLLFHHAFSILFWSWSHLGIWPWT